MLFVNLHADCAVLACIACALWCMREVQACPKAFVPCSKLSYVGHGKQAYHRMPSAMSHRDAVHDARCIALSVLSTSKSIYDVLDEFGMQQTLCIPVRLHS